MVIVDDMEDLSMCVGVTSMSMHERFSFLASTSQFLRAAPMRARRPSMNEGPLLNYNSNQHNIDDYETLFQQNQNWHSHSRSRSLNRAGSVSGGNNPSFGNLSRASSVGNVSHYSDRSIRSNGGYSNRSVVMTRQPRLDLSHRLQMRDAWMRGRRGHTRGRWFNNRGRGGYVQRGRVDRRIWTQNPWTRGRRRGARGNGYGRGRGRGNQNGGHFIMTRSRTKQNGYNYNGWNNNGRTNNGRTNNGWTNNEWTNNGWNSNGSNTGGNLNVRNVRGNTGRGRGRGRGKGRGRGGISHNSMPPLLTLKQLDKELDEYMASIPGCLDKELDEYMEQNIMDVEIQL